MNTSKSSIPLDGSNDTLIIIPTVADPEVLLPSMRLLVNRVPQRTRIMVSVNSDRPALADEAVESIKAMPLPEGVTVDVHVEDGLRGFGGAINIGLKKAINTGGLPEYTLIFNDDLRVTPGWLDQMIESMNATKVVSVYGTSQGEPRRK